LATVFIVLAACGDADPVAAGEDVDGVWELVEGRGPDGPLPLVDGHPVTLNIEGSQLGGNACNHYGATLTRDGNSVRIGELEATAMACEPAVMEVESAYFSALGDVDRVARDGDTLTLSGPSAELRFAPVPPVPTADLVGTTWTLETLIQGETASSVAGETAMLLLAADGSLTGSTGCREFTGAYTETGGEIVVTEMTMGEQDCPDDLRAQDSHVVEVIGDGFRVAVDGNTLTLSSRGELGLVYRAM
jgi:heat shock protein HslJ